MTTTIVVHRPPRFAEVVREQIGATLLSLRVPGIIGAALAVLVTFLALADFARGRGGVEFAPELSLIPAFAGVIIAVTAWLGEKRPNAGFFWTMPVDRSRHALAKVVAGWIILLAAVTAFVLWLLILALITKGNFLGEEIIKLLPQGYTDGQPVTPSMLRTVSWVPQPILWLTPFTAATGLYVIASGIMIGIKHPLRLIGAVIAGGLLIAAVGQGLESEAYWQKVGRIVDAVMRGRYGLDGLMSAGAESLKTAVRLTNGEVASVWHGLPSIHDWIIATLLWTGLGVAGLIAALWRHREQR